MNSTFRLPSLGIFILIITIAVSLDSCGKKSNEAITSASSDSTKVDSLGFKVETIVFKNGQTGATSNLPHLVVNSRNTYPADKVNDVIKDYFQLSSFDPDKEKDFSWVDVNYTAEIGKTVIILNIKGTYMGAYPNDIDETLHISKTDGKILPNTDIPLVSLFKEDGFFSVIDQYWKGKVKQKFDQASECAGEIAPSCSPYDIHLKLDGKNAILSLDNEDCYPHAAMACSPSLDVTIPIEKLKPFLSDFGNKVIESGYYQKTSSIERFEIGEQLKATMPNLLFIRLKRPGFQMENGPYFDFPETSIGITFNETKKGEGTLTAFFDMDALPDDFRSTDAFSINDSPIKYAGTFNYDGFVLTVECDPMNSGCLDSVTFTWSDQDTDGTVAVGHRWLKCDAGTILFAAYSNEEFFYSKATQSK